MSARLWWLLALPAFGVAGYAISLQDGRSAQNAVPGLPWLDEVHFAMGGLALLAGVFALRRDLLLRKRHWHRRIGWIYIFAVGCSGAAGLAMALFSSGGLVAHLGFGLLGGMWLLTTALGWRAIHHRHVARHRTWMICSYALCYAAVTLRVELPLLVMATGSFASAYRIVSWSCWLPNLLFAIWWLRRTKARPVPAPGAVTASAPAR